MPRPAVSGRAHCGGMDPVHPKYLRSPLNAWTATAPKRGSGNATFCAMLSIDRGRDRRHASLSEAMCGSTGRGVWPGAHRVWMPAAVGQDGVQWCADRVRPARVAGLSGNANPTAGSCPPWWRLWRRDLLRIWPRSVWHRWRRMGSGRAEADLGDRGGFMAPLTTLLAVYVWFQGSREAAGRRGPFRASAAKTYFG